MTPSMHGADVGGAGARVPTFRFAPVFHRAVEPWWILAAGLAALFAAAFALYSRGTHRDALPPGSPGDYAALLSSVHGDALPARLAPAWAVGSPAQRSPSLRARAVRIGARIVDLEIEARARNRVAVLAYYAHDSVAIAAAARYSAGVAALAHDLAADLDEVPHGAHAAALYRSVEQEGDDVATADHHTLRLARQAALVFQPRFLALGNWLEAARVAALRGDRAFLERAECQAEADAATSLPGTSRAGRAALLRVRRLLSTASYGDLRPLSRALTRALRTLAS